jgi:hypothetical protein
MFTAAKNILARTRKDPGMNVQHQEVDRLPSAIQAASTISLSEKVSVGPGLHSTSTMTGYGLE